MDPKKTKAGETIEVLQWRGRPAKIFEATATSDAYEEDGVLYIDTNMDTGHAVWNEGQRRWEDGEY